MFVFFTETYKKNAHRKNCNFTVKMLFHVIYVGPA